MISRKEKMEEKGELEGMNEGSKDRQKECR